MSDRGLNVMIGAILAIGVAWMTVVVVFQYVVPCKPRWTVETWR